MTAAASVHKAFVPRPSDQAGAAARGCWPRPRWGAYQLGPTRSSYSRGAAAWTSIQGPNTQAPGDPGLLR